MRASKIRFVAGTQQLLVLGAVFAVLVPAASVVSLDVIGAGPDHHSSGRQATGELAAAVPDQPVDAQLNEVTLTSGRAVPRPMAGRPDGRSPGQVNAPRAVGEASESAGEAPGTSVLTSAPQDVTGYGAVGLTWAPGQDLGEVSEGAFEVRTRTGKSWSEWEDVAYDADHAESADAAESGTRTARPGTDLLFVGEVDQAQVRVELPTEALPTDLKLAVVGPGEAPVASRETPEMSSTPEGAEESGSETGTQGRDITGGESGKASLELQAAARASQPQIFSRKQWGANESLRDGGPRYGKIQAGIVHHTVNANDYSQAQVPGIIRSIYAYHTRSRGWSDIGYNFLIDKFGRIWEGRAGGITKPVVGAHASEYNDVAFGVSVIGNYETAKPSSTVLNAFAKVMAWKLGLSGVDPKQRVTLHGRSFPAIIGHRDTKSTACPGRYLYAQLPSIRNRAAAIKGGGSTPAPTPTPGTGTGSGAKNSNLAASAFPDLIARSASNGKGYIVPTGGTIGFQKNRSLGRVVSRTLPSPDLTGDGKGDLYVIGGAGRGQVRAGNGNGGFGGYAGRTARKIFEHRDLVVAVGDINGDGRNDLVGRHRKSDRLTAYVNTGAGRLRGVWIRGGGWNRYNLLVGPGDVTGDGKADLLARDKSGRLWLRPGTGSVRSAFGAPRRVSGQWGGYDAIVGMGDYTGDGKADLLARSAATKKTRIFFGRGNGTFGVNLGPLPAFKRVDKILGAAQLVGNGRPDVLTRTGRAMGVTANAGTASLGSPIATGLNLRGYTSVINAGDWNRDGNGDLIGRSASGALHLFTGNGQGRFAAPRTIGRGPDAKGSLAAAGDMNGDRWPDLLVRSADGILRLHPGHGNGRLGAGKVLARNVSGQVLAAGRWNKDTAPDVLVRSGSRVTAYLGNGKGGLRAPRALGRGLPGLDQAVMVSSLRNQGHADLIVRRSDGALFALLGKSDGGLTRPRPLGEGLGGFDLLG